MTTTETDMIVTKKKKPTRTPPLFVAPEPDPGWPDDFVPLPPRPPAPTPDELDPEDWAAELILPPPPAAEPPLDPSVVVPFPPRRAK